MPSLSTISKGFSIPRPDLASVTIPPFQSWGPHMCAAQLAHPLDGADTWRLLRGKGEDVAGAFPSQETLESRLQQPLWKVRK